MNKTDIATVAIVAIMLSASIWMFRQYVLLPAPTTERCWYEVKYIHVSGRELTKPVYCTCDGFYPWYASDKYKVEMTIPFSNGEKVRIQGATDILSVAKKKEP